MSTELSGPIYVLLSHGEVTYVSVEEGAVLEAAQEDVNITISDHYRHDLPFSVDPSTRNAFDVKVHRLDDSSRVTLPLQEWVDDYYARSKKSDTESEEYEYHRYLQLHEKWNERRTSENFDCAVKEFPSK